MNWIKIKLLKWHKSKVLLEVQADMQFIREFKPHRLAYDETDARMQIANIRRSEISDDEKSQRLDPISKDLHDAQAVKAEYEKLVGMEADLTQYISML
jgi:hypothetical protein